jgi:hypothetical protein
MPTMPATLSSPEVPTPALIVVPGRRGGARTEAP